MITVFGSLNADLVCPVEHLPAPGETVTGPGYSVVPGGKGANQALAAALAGAPVRFVGAVGRDGFRAPALSGLQAGGVDLSALADSERQTACAFIGVDAKGENQIIVASGANLDARADQLLGRLPGPGPFRPRRTRNSETTAGPCLRERHPALPRHAADNARAIDPSRSAASPRSDTAPALSSTAPPA
jgi:ribokinase